MYFFSLYFRLFYLSADNDYPALDRIVVTVTDKYALENIIERRAGEMFRNLYITVNLMLFMYESVSGFRFQFFQYLRYRIVVVGCGDFLLPGRFCLRV